MLQGECAENRDYTLCLAKNSLQDKGSKWRSDVKISRTLIQIHFLFIRKEGDMVCKALPSEISWELQLTSPACKSCPRHGSLYNTHRTNGAWSAHPGGETCTKPRYGLTLHTVNRNRGTKVPLVSGKPKLAFQSEWLLKRDLVSWVENDKTGWTDQWLKWNETNLLYNHNAHLDLVQAAYLKQWYISHPAEYFFKASVPGRTTMSTTCNRLVLFNASTVTLGTWPVEVPWDSLRLHVQVCRLMGMQTSICKRDIKIIYIIMYTYIYMIIYQQFPLVCWQSPGKTSSAFPKLL